MNSLLDCDEMSSVNKIYVAVQHNKPDKLEDHWSFIYYSFGDIPNIVYMIICTHGTCNLIPMDISYNLGMCRVRYDATYKLVIFHSKS